MSFIAPCPHDGRYPRWCARCAAESPEMVPVRPDGTPLFTPPAHFGEQLLTRGGLPRELQDRIDAIDRGWGIEPEPRPAPSRWPAWLGRAAGLLAVLGALALAGRGLP